MTPSGIEPATFRFVEQHLNHCATANETSLCGAYLYPYRRPPPLHRAFMARHMVNFTFYRFYQVINAVFGNDHCVRAETCMKQTFKIHSVGKTQDILNVTAGVTESRHCALNG